MNTTMGRQKATMRCEIPGEKMKDQGNEKREPINEARSKFNEVLDYLRIRLSREKARAQKLQMPAGTLPGR